MRVLFGATAGGAVLALTAALLGPSAAGAHGTGRAAVDADSAVIALGDSFISGEAGRWRGNGNTPDGSAYGTDLATIPSSCDETEESCANDPHRVYGDTYDPAGKNGCDRSVWSEITYAESVKVGGVDYAIPKANRLNAACSGATTEAVVKDGFKGEKAQTTTLRQHAASKKVRMVVLSIGGNDIGFGAIIADCMKGFMEGSIFGWHCHEYHDPDIDGMKERVRGAVRAIRSTMKTAGYAKDSYRLVLQSYPAPIPRGGEFRYQESGYDRYTYGGCPFWDDDATWAHDTLVPKIADALRDLATEESKTGEGDVGFLDLRRALAGHEACAKAPVGQSVPGNTLSNPRSEATSEWVRYYGGWVEPQGQEQETLHPNFYGQKRLGACLNQLATRADRVYSCPQPS
ncbi:hypothetical protein [Streptomyces sp. NPDC048057]|uniref:hypothetical protein n=1 Tax=Streptomyces sp. NPDC048057 TaxID=3155628 RepID=UPI0033C09E6E